MINVQFVRNLLKWKEGYRRITRHRRLGHWAISIVSLFLYESSLVPVLSILNKADFMRQIGHCLPKSITNIIIRLIPIDTL